MVSSKVFNINALLFFVVMASSMVGLLLVSSYQFEVGGEKGWTKPTGNESETYNGWATENRFHIGDTIYFKYDGDSVLVVNASGYRACNTSDPISRYEDGNTVFQFKRPGFFYFISGNPGHCRSGQRLIVRVIHPSEEMGSMLSPATAPSPASSQGQGGDIWDSSNGGTPPAMNFISMLGAALLFLYCLV